MPTYQFACPTCATTFEEKRSFSRADDPAICPSCQSAGAEKVIGTAMFFTPGSAAKALLEPKSPARASAGHASGCPCCSVPRRAVADADA